MILDFPTYTYVRFKNKKTHLFYEYMTETYIKELNEKQKIEVVYYYFIRGEYFILDKKFFFNKEGKLIKNNINLNQSLSYS